MTTSRRVAATVCATLLAAAGCGGDERSEGNLDWDVPLDTGDDGKADSSTGPAADLTPFSFDRSAPPRDGSLSIPDATQILRRLLRPGESLQNVNVLSEPAYGALLEGVAVSNGGRRIRYLSAGSAGQAVDYQAWYQAAYAAAWRRYGKLDPDLVAMLDGGKGAKEGLVDVMVIVRRPPGITAPTPPAGLGSYEKVKSFVSDVNKRNERLWTPRLKAVSAWLSRQGAVEPGLIARLGLVTARLPVQLLRSRGLQRHPDVIGVYPPPGPGKPALYRGYRAMGGPFFGGMCDGSSGYLWNAPDSADNQCIGDVFPIDAAIMEEGGGSLIYPHDYLYRGKQVAYHVGERGSHGTAINSCTMDAECPPSQFPTQYHATCRNGTCVNVASCSRSIDCYVGIGQAEHFECVSGECINLHATAVAGSIGSWGPFGEQGPAPGNLSASFLYQGYPKYTPYYSGQRSLANSMGWVTDNNIIFANHSYGAPDEPSGILKGFATGFALLQTYDINSAARYNFLLMTQAAGNDADSPDPNNWKTNCGYAVNALCVGAYDYGQNYRDRSLSTVVGWSQWKNPTTAPDREVPHVVGPGSGVWTLSTPTGPGVRGGAFHPNTDGTSFSAPSILGLTMGAWEYAGWLSLYGLPIVRKAVIINSGMSVKYMGTQLPSVPVGQPTDQRAGSGAPDAQAIGRMVDPWNSSVEVVDARQEDFDRTGLYVRRQWQAFVPAGYTLRATIAWNTCPTNRIGPDGAPRAPLLDFDLAISSPANSPGRPACNGQAQVSASHSSEYEMVEESCLKDAKEGGLATIQLRYKPEKGFGRCGDETSERVAIAWDLRRL